MRFEFLRDRILIYGAYVKRTLVYFNKRPIHRLCKLLDDISLANLTSASEQKRLFVTISPKPL